MANQSQKNEENQEANEEIKYSFANIKKAVEYIETFDIEKLYTAKETADNNNATLDEGNEELAVAFRKVLASKTLSNRAEIKKKFQAQFDIRSSKDSNDAKKIKARGKIAILSRAMRTATDKEAFKRGLWEFEYTITCNTVKNNGIAQFTSKDHKEAEAETEKPITTNEANAFDWAMKFFDKSTFNELARLVNERFVFEQQNIDCIFVPSSGNTKACFKAVEVA